MTTVILVLLCLAIAGRELYLASDKRLPRAQEELGELRKQLTELAKRHEALKAEVAAGREPSGIPIPQPQRSVPGLEADRRSFPDDGGRTDRLRCSSVKRGLQPGWESFSWFWQARAPRAAGPPIFIPTSF